MVVGDAPDPLVRAQHTDPPLILPRAEVAERGGAAQGRFDDEDAYCGKSRPEGILTTERSERGELPRNEHFEERALASDEKCESVYCILSTQ